MAPYGSRWHYIKGLTVVGVDQYYRGCSGSLMSALCHNICFLYVKWQPCMGVCVELGLQLLDWIV